MLIQQKPTTCNISQLYFDIIFYMFLTDILSIISSLDTAFTANGICDTESNKQIGIFWKYTAQNP